MGDTCDAGDAGDAGDAHRLAAPAVIHPGPPDPGRGRCTGRRRLMDQRRGVWGGEARTVRCCLRSFIARVRGGALVVFCSLYLSDLFFFRKQSQAPQKKKKKKKKKKKS